MVCERDRTSELYVLFDVARRADGHDDAGGLSVSAPLLHGSTSGRDARAQHCNDGDGGGGGGGGVARAVTCGGGGSGSGSHEMQTFNHFAQMFARGVAEVSEDIMRLTQLTTRQSVFDDQSSEINGLTQKIKAWLQQLHDDLDTLEELKLRAVDAQRRAWQSRSRGDGPSGGASSRGLFAFTGGAGAGGRSAQRHGDVVVDTLKCRLARSGQAFRATLQNQSRVMKSSAVRRHLFTAADRPQTFESALFQDQEQQQQQQLLLGAPRATSEQYYRQRMEAVAEIEASVAQVGELFSDFSRLVQEQGETIIRIDTDVDDALRNVNAGSNELIRYLGNISSNRGLIVKLLAILFAFLLFFGLVVVR